MFKGVGDGDVVAFRLGEAVGVGEAVVVKIFGVGDAVGVEVGKGFEVCSG